MLRALRHVLFLVSLAFVAGLARDAHAGDPAAAQALFDQGKKLMNEKKYAEACPKFEESQKLDPGLGTMSNIAFCYESMGRTATAWSVYLDLASQAKAAGQAQREQKARESAKALEPKLSKITIQVEKPAPGIEVKRNSDPVGQASWGLPIPVDPGQVKISAVAPSRKQWTKTVTIDKPGETTVTVPELEKGEPPPGYSPAPTTTGTTTSPPNVYYQPNGNPPPGATTGNLPPPPPRMKRRSGGLFGGGIACTVVGGIGLLAGVAVLAIDSAGGGGVGTGAGVLAGSALLMGGGIAMIVIGNKKVPVDPNESKKLQISPMPEIQVGLTNANLKWEF